MIINPLYVMRGGGTVNESQARAYVRRQPIFSACRGLTVSEKNNWSQLLTR